MTHYFSNYGKDIDKVYPFWVIKEGDEYIPPKHKGLEVTPRNGKKKDCQVRL